MKPTRAIAGLVLAALGAAFTIREAGRLRIWPRRMR